MAVRGLHALAEPVFIVEGNICSAVMRGAGVRFVWIMGADNLRQFHLWRHWRDIADLVPIAVIDRPGSRVLEAEAARFADLEPPAFIFLHGPRSELSSTVLRGNG